MTDHAALAMTRHLQADDCPRCGVRWTPAAYVGDAATWLYTCPVCRISWVAGGGEDVHTFPIEEVSA